MQPTRTGKVRLIALSAVFVALAIAVVWMWRGAPTQPDLDEGRAVAETFLERIRTGHAAEAWESTTAEFKSAEGREYFLKRIKEQPVLSKQLKFVSVQTVSIQESPRAEYVYRAADSPVTVRLLAGNDRGRWRIDRLSVQ